jgi:hypothetical protein
VGIDPGVRQLITAVGDNDQKPYVISSRQLYIPCD